MYSALTFSFLCQEMFSLSLLTVIKAYFWKPSPGAFPLKKENQTTIISETDIQELFFIVTGFATITIIRGRGCLDALNHLMFQFLGDAVQCMKGCCDIWSPPNWFANPSSQSWFRSVLTVFRFYVFDCYIYCLIQWKVNVVFVCKESCFILWDKLSFNYIHSHGKCRERRTFLVLSRSLLIMYTNSSILKVCFLQSRKYVLKSVTKRYPITQEGSYFKLLPCITFCACIMRKRAVLLAAR